MWKNPSANESHVKTSTELKTSYYNLLPLPSPRAQAIWALSIRPPITSTNTPTYDVISIYST